MQQLRTALGAEADACDAETLAWLLRDRKLDVEKATAKVLAPARLREPLRPGLTRPRRQIRAYLQWRAGGFSGLTAADVAREAATGKAQLLLQRDLVRAVCAPACSLLRAPRVQAPIARLLSPWCPARF
jgi:hypothetical protein